MTESSEPNPSAPSDNDAATRRFDPRKVWVALAVLAGLAALVVWMMGDKGTEPVTVLPEDQSAQRPKSPPLELPVELQPVRYSNPGYVGANVCGECHQSRLDEFRGTRHFIACCTPDGEHAPTGFDADSAEISSPHWPFRFQPLREDNGYFEQVTGTTPAQRVDERHRIDMVYGAKGKADEVYFTWRQNRLYELPFAWLTPWNCWGKQVYGDLGDNVLRSTTPRCLECHTTYFEHVPGTENEYNRDSILPGVTCERCHGPGREHVEHHRAHPGLEQGIAVVHPGRLSRERQMDLCGQCHTPALHHRDQLFSYRPGEDLEAHFRSVTIEGVENEHVANQGRYLRRSKCFQESDTLTCHTCHDPHKPTDAKLVADACAKCHPPTACRARETLPSAVRDQCVDCHMPNYNRVAIKFRTVEDEYIFPLRPRQHQIGLYPRAQQEVLLGWHRQQATPESRQMVEQLTQDLVDSWTKEGDDLLAADRPTAAIGSYREALRFAPTAATQGKMAEAIKLQSQLDMGRIAVQYLIAQGRTNEAIESLEALLKLSPKQASVHGRLGTMYELKGQHEKALEHWELVNRYDPDDAYGYNMRGWTAYLGGRHAEALEAFRRADELLPSTAEINYRWGLTCLSAGDAQQAVERLKLALRANPNHVGAMQAMSHALRELGKAMEAVPFAAEAARRSNYATFDLLISWIDACLNAGREDDARDAIDRAKLQANTTRSRQMLEERSQRLSTIKPSKSR